MEATVEDVETIFVSCSAEVEEAVAAEEEAAVAVEEETTTMAVAATTITATMEEAGVVSSC